MNLLDIGKDLFTKASTGVSNFLQQYPTPASFIQKQAAPQVQQQFQQRVVQPVQQKLQQTELARINFQREQQQGIPLTRALNMPVLGPMVLSPALQMGMATKETAQSWADIPKQIVNKVQGKSSLPIRQMSPEAQQGLDWIGMGFAAPPAVGTEADTLNYLKLKGEVGLRDLKNLFNTSRPQPAFQPGFIKIKENPSIGYRGQAVGSEQGDITFFTDKKKTAEAYAKVNTPISGKSEIVTKDLTNLKLKEVTKKTYLDEVVNPEVRTNYDGVKFQDGKTTSYGIFKKPPSVGGEIPKGGVSVLPKRGMVEPTSVRQVGKLPPQELKATTEIKTPIQSEKVQPVSGGPSSPPIIPQDPEQVIIQALGEAKPLEKQQGQIYAKIRSQQAGKIAGIGESVPGEAGFHAQLGALKGSMPKVTFESVRKQVTQPVIDSLFNKVEQSNLSPFEKITAKSGLSKLLGAEGGTVPVQSELKLLGEIFSPKFIEAVMAKRPWTEKLFANVVDALNIPRSVMATADMSSVQRHMTDYRKN
jgi:hypothetical protein